MSAAPSRVPRTLRGAAKRRQAASSLAPAASGHERSMRPSQACFLRPQSTRATGGDR